MFKVEAFFNPFLASGQTRLDAVLTISSDADVAGAMPGIKEVGFVLDVSGSMENKKLAEAKLAARRGIDMLPDSAWLFVVAFHGRAQVVVKSCQATAENKLLAHQAIQALKAGGSTAMSTGLELALAEVKRTNPAIASVYFLTDGDNGPDDHDRLVSVIKDCTGFFQCDCRGVGTGWKPAELRQIASALLGTADAITDPSGLEEDFSAFLSRTLSKGIAGAKLRLWSPKVVKTVQAKQMSPDIQDLLPLASRVDEKTLDIPLGSWGAEARDYQLVFELPAGAVGEEVLACRAAIICQGPQGELKIPCDNIAVKWSEDDALTTRISKEVAHYTGQTELAESIREGLEAKEQGDEDKATRLLGRATQLAEASGNEEVTRRLRKVVDVIDASAGTVRLRKSDKAAEMELEMGGTRTVRRRIGTAQAPSIQS